MAHADQCPALSGGPGGFKSPRSTSNRGTPAASIRFPPSNFKHFLTLFSKSFSSFPRGTCSLSVSCPYLALDGIYHPLRAAFPNSPTRRQQLVEQHGVRTRRGCHPLRRPFPGNLGPVRCRGCFSRLQLPPRSGGIFKLGYFRFARRY